MPTRAATEPWLMIDPPPEATMDGAAAWEHRNVPLALTAKLRSQSSSVASTTDPRLFTPALLYRMSTRWYSLRICSKALVTCSRSATLAATASAVPPEAAICSAASLAASALRSTTATAAPSRANRAAAARPMPEPAPVTTAVLPASLPVIVSRLLLRNENHPPCCLRSQRSPDGAHSAVSGVRAVRWPGPTGPSAGPAGPPSRAGTGRRSQCCLWRSRRPVARTHRPLGRACRPALASRYRTALTGLSLAFAPSGGQDPLAPRPGLPARPREPVPDGAHRADIPPSRTSGW